MNRIQSFSGWDRSWFLLPLALAAAVAPSLPQTVAAAPAVSAHRDSLTLPTYPWWPAVPHPYFRGTDGKNIYRYPMLDNLSREKMNRTFQTVVLENKWAWTSGGVEWNTGYSPGRLPRRQESI